MLRFYRKLREDESGATAIEYGLIAGLISVVIISSLTIV
jgi:pilus assembly protein Flp/PilA